VDIDPHEYYSEAPNWWPNPDNPEGAYIYREGQVNPDRFQANKSALGSMCDAVFSLGSAAYFLDDARYAQRAARMLNTWFINPKTRMNPDLEYAQAIRGNSAIRGAGIIEGRVMIRAIQGMEFLTLAGSWDPKEQAAVRKWFEDYLHWLTTSKNGLDEKHSGNNHSSWWAAQVAAVATFVGNPKEEQMAFNFYRDRLFPRQIRSDGSAPREELRTRSFFYSALNLEAFANICRIAQVNGTDLWSISSKRGATIATVIDYLQPDLSDPRKWSREQVVEFSNDQLYLLAFAGMGMKKPDYVALFHKLERSEGAWLSVVDLLVGRWEAASHHTRH